MKKLKRIKLDEIDAVELHEDQMKQIKGRAGYGCSASSCAGPCTVQTNNLSRSGKCDWDVANGYLVCGCKV